MFYRYLFALAAVLCAAAAYAVEPPTIRDAEPPSIVACECSTGAPCICGDSCSCTVPIQFTRVPAGSHAHTLEDGTVIVHGDENHGNAAAHEGIAYPWYKTARAGDTVFIGAPPRSPFATENCPDGNCPRASAPRIVGTAGVVRSVYGIDRPRLFSGDRPRVFDGTGWHPGKVLGAVFGRLRGCR